MGIIMRNNVAYSGSGGSETVELSMAEYEAREAAGAIDSDTWYLIYDATDSYNAKKVVYDNAESGMTARTVQGAIDELNSNLNEQNKNLNVIYNADDDYIYVMGHKWKFVGLNAHALIPVLSSNTGNNGYTIVTNEHTNCKPWMAFDNNNDTVALTSDAIISANEFVGYMFNKEVTISKVYAVGGAGNAETKTYSMEIQYGNSNGWHTVPDTYNVYTGGSGLINVIDLDIEPIKCIGVRVFFHCDNLINGSVRTFQVYGTEV